MATFDVYHHDKRYLLVVRKGFPIPLDDAPGRWRKSKRRVVSVSDEIGLAVQRQGKTNLERLMARRPDGITVAAAVRRQS